LAIAGEEGYLYIAAAFKARGRMRTGEIGRKITEYGFR